MLDVGIIALVDGLGKLLDLLDLLLIQLVDLLDDLEGPVALAVDLEDLLSVVLPTLLVDLHAIVGPLCTLDMEVDLAVLLEALDCGADVHALLSADDAANAELLEVEAIHLDRRLRRYLWTLRPH